MYKSNKEIDQEFDEKFGIYSNYADFCPDKKEYTDHISQIRQNDLESHIEKLKGMKRPYWRGNIDEEKNKLNHDTAIYNQTLDEIISYHLSSLNQVNE